MQKLYVNGWNEWQSFRKDRGAPPWIKIHRNLMSNHKWAGLSDSEKGQIVSIWIVAADDNGRIPNDAKIVRKVCQLDDVPDIEKFIEIGMLCREESTGCQDDANLTSTGCQDDAPEERRGEQSRGDQSRGEEEGQQLKNEIFSKREFLIAHTKVTEENFEIVAAQCIAHYGGKNLVNPLESVLSWFKREWSPSKQTNNKNNNQKSSQTAKGMQVFDEIDRRASYGMGDQGSEQWPETPLLTETGSDTGSGLDCSDNSNVVRIHDQGIKEGYG